MKLFHISQEANQKYDSYDSAVVAAPDEETARKMRPSDGLIYPNHNKYSNDWGGYSWCKSPDDVIVHYLGEATNGIGQGVVCASFNAG